MYNHQGRRGNHYHSQTEPAAVPDRPVTTEDHPREPARILSYIDPVDTLLNQPPELLSHTSAASSSSCAAPKYEDPSSFTGSNQEFVF